VSNELFWKLLKPVHPRAEAFCRRLAGNRDEGDDLYQEGLLLALRKFGSLREKAAFRAWLFRLLINCYKNRRRSEWLTRHIRLTGKLGESGEGFDPRGQFSSRRWLKRALKVLSPENRALIALFEIEGWSVAELAEMYHKPEGTIKARLSRSRQKMRKELERYLPKQKTNHSASEGEYALQRSKTSDK
jgi:RNA polymerase sigma-70 factor (ECF subfamily)